MATRFIPNVTSRSVYLFSLSERQAQAILDLRLARLTKLEIYKLEEEHKELQEKIKYLTEIVNSAKLLTQVVKNELLEIKKKYKTPRKSVLTSSILRTAMIKPSKI